MDRTMNRFVALTVFVLTVALCGAEEEGEARAFKFGKVERELLEETRSAEALFREQGAVVENRALESWLERVGSALVGRQAALENVAFRFRVLREVAPNVIALPNGSVYVTTGMLARLAKEEELAGVMAQGVAEVTNRQGYAFLRTLRMKSLARDLTLVTFPAARLVMGGMSGLLRGGPAIQAATAGGYGRKLEEEAGQEALRRLAAAGYEPQALPRALKRLAAAAEEEESRFRYESRRGLAAREQALGKLAAGMAGTGAAGQSEEDYVAQAEGAIQENLRAEIAAGDGPAALAQARRLTGWKEKESRYQLLLADALLAAKDATQAEAVYRRLVDSEPALADAHYGLARLLEQAGRKDDAAAEYRKYLETAPGGALGRRRVERRLARMAAPDAGPDAPLRRACVAPAEISVKRTRVESAEWLAKQTEAWRGQLGRLVETYLVRAGVEVAPFRGTAAELREIRAAYDPVAEEMEKRASEARKGQFSIDDAVALLPCAAGADTVVMVRARVEAVGKELRLLWSRAPAVQAGFVDARTGKVFDVVVVNGDDLNVETTPLLGPTFEGRIAKVKKRR
jgi:predicted Zn-dependent protease